MTARTTLGVYGPKRGRIRVLIESGAELVRVLWREHGRRRVKSWPNTPAGRVEAKAWAEGFSESCIRTAPDRVACTAELWERFAAAEFPHLRPRTQQLYAQRWRRWQVFIGHTFPASEATLENLDQYRAALTKVGMAPNQIGEHLKQMKLVYAWAERRELVARNRIALYRFKLAKEERRNEPAEYRLEDFERLIAQLSPQSSRSWRPWALLMVLGHQGIRVRAALHLRWEDIDFAEGRITWRAAFDKLGREWSQPLRVGTYSALLTAKWWRERTAREGTPPPAEPSWVFFSTDARSSTRADGREMPGVYRIQAFWSALQQAERAAGVPHMALRAAHGFRRMVAGEVLAQTGDPKLAMDFIGDTDLRVMQRYLKRRDDRLTAVALQLDTPKGATEVPREPALGKVAREKRAAVRAKQSHRSDLNRRPLDYESRALPLSYGGAVIQQRLTALVERSTLWCQWWCQNHTARAPPTAPLT